jgi:hypothetical protein
MRSEDELPKLAYNLEETIRITGLKRTTLWKAVKSGKLKKCDTGTDRLLFTLEAIREFLSNRRDKRDN